MLPKIATALARVLDPIKPVARPGQNLTLAKPSDSGEGGYGTPGYDARAENREEAPSDGKEESSERPLAEDGVHPEHAEKKLSGIPFQPGLTQVILDLNASRLERSTGNAVESYETGAKDQKKNARLPKGSMLYKKVG